MNKTIATLLLLLATIGLKAQPNSNTYFLPATAMKFQFLVEKTVYTPGELATYAQRYMKKTGVRQEPYTEYRIISTQMIPVGVPDTTKQFQLSNDRRFSISEVQRDESGTLLAINTAHPAPTVELPTFTPSRKRRHLNPSDFMNEDILTTGSTAKMAELCAQEIYDIRDSRNQLQRGQAENMPKDGQQLRIMMDGLDTQERALMQVFEGQTDVDTTQVTIDYLPTQAVERQLLFRFSRHFGFCDADDLAGAPYYVTVVDERNAKPDETKGKDKKPKDELGLYVNVPGRIQVALYKEDKVMEKYTLNAAQFGKIEPLSPDLFGKKMTSQIILSPITGAIESIKEAALEK